MRINITWLGYMPRHRYVFNMFLSSESLRTSCRVVCAACRILVGMTPWEPRITRDCTSRLSATLQTAATSMSTGQPCQTRAVLRANHSLCLMCTSCVTWLTTTWLPTTGINVVLVTTAVRILGLTTLPADQQCFCSTFWNNMFLFCLVYLSSISVPVLLSVLFPVLVSHLS